MIIDINSTALETIEIRLWRQHIFIILTKEWVPFWLSSEQLADINAGNTVVDGSLRAGMVFNKNKLWILNKFGQLAFQ